MKVVLTVILMKIIKETFQQLIEKDEGTETFKNKWYEEECKFATEKMKKAIEKWLIKGRKEKEEQEYHHKRKEAHKKLGIRKDTQEKCKRINRRRSEA